MRLPVLFPLILAAFAARADAAPSTQVFVLGSLYSRHQDIAAYDLGALRRVVLAIDPDVLVVDCTPTEVREQKVHPSKIEYPQVIFPLVQQHGYRVYAAEPDEPLFTQIVQPLAQARSAFAKAKPEQARILDEYDEATWSALALYWQSPADAHDETTGACPRGPQGARHARLWRAPGAGEHALDRALGADRAAGRRRESRQEDPRSGRHRQSPGDRARAA